MPSHPTYEYSVYVRFVRDGQLGPLNRRLFPTASQALEFVAGIQHQVGLTIMAREVGSWESLDRLDLERHAAEEARR